jgi:hypothetical protein
MTKAEPVAGSFRDPSGFVFHRDGAIYRQVNPVYADNYDRLMESGLYEALTSEGLLVSHEEVPEAEPAAPGAYKILRPSQLEFISYPWEWCFSQLKAGALATLRLQELAIEHGMSLKDASAFNIQFHAGKPLFIDTLSFERYEEGRPWVAYRQFCQHFLAPLAVMAYTDHRLGRILRTFIDGLPLDLASRMLPRKTRFKLGLMTHLHLQAKAEASLSSESGRASKERVHKVSKRGLLGILDSLKGVVNGLRWKPAGTTWADYYSETNYSDEGRDDKHEQVARMVAAVAPETVWDLGANTGVFSEIAAETARLTLSFDMDEAAVERNYLRCVERGSSAILPLILDLANPSPGVGWASRERLPLLERGRPDLVLALALIHHLAIGNNLPLGHVADYLREVSPNLIIEFVPKSDSQVQRMLATREDIFADYHQEGFEAAFGARFEIRDSVKLRDTERTLYLLSAT